MFNVFRPIYSPLGSQSDSSRSDDEHRRFLDCKDYDQRPPTTESTHCSLIPHYSILIPWILAVVNLGLFLNQYLRHPSDLECARLLSPYCMSRTHCQARRINSQDIPAPAIEAGIIEYYDTNFENEFGGKSDYIGPPTPELERRWDDLWGREILPRNHTLDR